MSKSAPPRLTSLAGLSEFASSPAGEMQYLPVAVIDEDPSQPRRRFDDATLLELGNDILAHGQLQPVGVVSTGNGRYVLKFGARRLRACKLVGIPKIAYVLANRDHGVAAQVAENQQREGLSNTDLSEAIARLTESGMKNKEIARVAGIKEYEIKYFRSLATLPGFLVPWRDKADARALTELYQAWDRHEDARASIEAAVSEAEEVTVAGARRIIASTTGKVIQSVVPIGHLVQTKQETIEPGHLVQKEMPGGNLLRMIVERARKGQKKNDAESAIQDIKRMIMENENESD